MMKPFLTTTLLVAASFFTLPSEGQARQEIYPYYGGPQPARSYDDHRRYDKHHYKGYETSRQTRKDVQRELARRRYYRGPIDGDLGRYSRAAIRNYQIDRRLPVSGRIDRPLLRSLRLL